jgi:hypothetical protein
MTVTTRTSSNNMLSQYTIEMWVQMPTTFSNNPLPMFYMQTNGPPNLINVPLIEIGYTGQQTNSFFESKYNGITTVSFAHFLYYAIRLIGSNPVSHFLNLLSLFYLIRLQAKIT